MTLTTRPYAFELNGALSSRATLGLIALSTDATIEQEWRNLINVPGVEFHTGRVLSDATVNPDTLAEMEQRLETSARALLTGQTLDVIAYACTSASLVIGETQVERALQQVFPGASVTTPLTAVKQAVKCLGSKRIAMLTPYIDTINQQMANHLSTGETKVVVMGSFLNDQDPEVVRISGDSIESAAIDLAFRESPDLLFIACTALRGAHLVDRLETSLGIPVTTSNHAMAWHALRLAHVDDQYSGCGILFSNH